MARPTPQPPVLTGDVLLLNQIVQFVGQKCQFSMYYRWGTTAPSEADARTNVASLNRAWLATQVPNVQLTLSAGTILTESRVWSLKWPNVATDILSSGNIAGSRPGDPLPPQIAQVLSKRTFTRGRSGRGRMYLCGMSETDSTAGQQLPAFVTVAQTLANQLVGNITDVTSGRTYTPVVVSTVSYLLIVPAPVAGPFWTVRGDDIVHMVADDIWYTQRRRTINKGQ